MPLLINKDNLFNENMIKDYVMVEYENYEEKTLYIEEETYRYFEMLKMHLKIDNIIIDIEDAYRSLEKQENIFLYSMKEYGLDKTEELVSMPGTTEHHTGEAINFAIYLDDKWLTKEKVEQNSKIINKIHNDLKHFGFILRYPKGKEKITKKEYKPWHIRYIGVEDALKIGNLTLEEYLKKN